MDTYVQTRPTAFRDYLALSQRDLPPAKFPRQKK
jgi:hypothetical protein